MVIEQAYFVTVDWCGKGERGVFCSRDGKAFRSDVPHTEEKMREILGLFWRILSPLSELFSKGELTGKALWTPLPEFSNQYGIARFVDEMGGGEL